MFALIETYEPRAYDLPATRVTWGEPKVVAIANTLEEAQAAWDKRYDLENLSKQHRTFSGILGPDGLMNYFGERLKDTTLGVLEVRMGVFRD